MSLEAATTINQLDPANPAGPDRLANGDDHLRLIKAVLKNTFPNITGPMTLTHTALNALAAGLMPFGVISLWYGASSAVPAGYAVCDGSTVAKSDGTGTVTVPDLRGRVPVGASATHLTGTTFGQDSKTITTEVGGAHNHVGATTAGEGTHTHTVGGTALTVAQMPSHNHGLRVFNRGDTDAAGGSVGSGDDTVSAGSSYAEGYIESEGGGQAHTHTLSGDGAHAHTLTIDAVPAHAHAATIDVTQASIALHYIMKI